MTKPQNIKLTFEKELSNLLNRHCKENESDTPDFLLADYLVNCLKTYNSTVKARDQWFDIDVWRSISKHEKKDPTIISKTPVKKKKKTRATKK